MSLLSDYNLRHSLSLQHRVASALVIAAEDIRNESIGTTNHANRLAWAKKMLNSDTGPENEAKSWMWMIIQNATIKASGDAADDTDIQNVINSLIDFFA